MDIQYNDIIGNGQFFCMVDPAISVKMTSPIRPRSSVPFYRVPYYKNEILVGSGSGDFGRIRIQRFWWDPDPKILFGSVDFGRIRIQRFWSDPDPEISVGYGSRDFGGIRIRRFWSDP